MLTPIFAADHVLAFAQTLRGGGVERAMLRLASGWLAAGRRVSLVIGDAQGPLSAELPAGADLHILGDGSYGALRALPAFVRELRPDILFCPGNHYGGAALHLRLRLGGRCPPIVQKVSNRLERHDQNPLVAAAYRLWLRAHPRFIDHIVAMTPAMRDETIRTMGIAPGRVSVIPNPPALRRADAVAVALPSGRFLLGVGRLAPQKRWDRLIAALPKLADRAVHLVLLGEGECRPELETQIAALGLAERVHLPGYHPDPSVALNRAALVALTSDFEGVPGVLREALAQGTPVVSTESSVAVREIVSTPELGSVIPVDDGEALVAALDHWLAPGRARPAPTPEAGADSADRYLALFDELVRDRAIRA